MYMYTVYVQKYMYATSKKKIKKILNAYWVIQRKITKPCA